MFANIPSPVRTFALWLAMAGVVGCLVSLVRWNAEISNNVANLQIEVGNLRMQADQTTEMAVVTRSEVGDTLKDLTLSVERAFTYQDQTDKQLHTLHSRIDNGGRMTDGLTKRVASLEKGYTPPADWSPLVFFGWAVGGMLLGMLVHPLSRWLSRWLSRRRFT